MSSKRLLGAFGAVVALVALPLTLVVSAPSAEAAGSNTLTVTAGEYAYSLKGSPKAGNVQIDFVNGGVEYHMMAMVKLKPGVTAAQMKKAALSQDDKAFAKIAQGDGQVAPFPGVLGPSQKMSMITKLAAGHNGMMCYIAAPSDGAPHFAHGMVKVFDVSSSKSSLTTPTDGVVDITLTDTAVNAPSTGIPAKGYAKITNNATTARDLNLALITGDATIAQVDTYFNTFFNSGTAPAGSAPGTVVGGVIAVPKGATTYLALDFAKGRYGYSSTNSELDNDPKPILGEFTIK